MYLVWRSNGSLSDKYAWFRRGPRGFKAAHWKTGKAFTEEPASLTFECTPDSPSALSDLILTGFNVPILSPKAVAMLDQLGVSNLQYFPVTLKVPKTGQVVESYKIANVVGFVDCLDRDNSVFQTFVEDDAISHLEKYSIFEEKIAPTSSGEPRPLIFRLGEHRYHLLVDETIRTAFEKEGITGSEFIRPEDYD